MDEARGGKFLFLLSVRPPPASFSLRGRPIKAMFSVLCFSVFFIAMASRFVAMPYVYDWEYYARKGKLGEGHDLGLILARLLLPLGPPVVLLVFSYIFVVSAAAMISYFCALPELIFPLACFSFSFAAYHVYFLLAQMLSLSLFMLGVALLWRRRYLLAAVSLVASPYAHLWTGVFLLLLLSCYLALEHRQLGIKWRHLLPAFGLVPLTAYLRLKPWEWLKHTSLACSLTQAAFYSAIWESPVFVLLAAVPMWKLRHRHPSVLFLLWLAVPLIILLLLWSPYWSYRLFTLIPWLPLSAAGCSHLVEEVVKWMSARKGRSG